MRIDSVLQDVAFGGDRIVESVIALTALFSDRGSLRVLDKPVQIRLQGGQVAVQEIAQLGHAGKHRSALTISVQRGRRAAFLTAHRC